MLSEHTVDIVLPGSVLLFHSVHCVVQLLIVVQPEGILVQSCFNAASHCASLPFSFDSLLAMHGIHERLWLLSCGCAAL